MADETLAATADEAKERKFAVFCEAEGFERPLFMHNLSFTQVLDDIVVPLERNEPFFVDGAPLTKQKVRRLKVLAQREFFGRLFSDLHWRMRQSSDVKVKQVLGEQYHVRLEAILRESTDDVTAQVMRAFSTEIKPRLKDYLPNRKELIEAALKVFVEGMKMIGHAS
jgi:hypothetical protein